MKIEFIQFRASSARFASVLFVLMVSATHMFADSVVTRTRTVTKVAEGVYVIRHPDAPDTFPQGNTTVIIGEPGVITAAYAEVWGR